MGRLLNQLVCNRANSSVKGPAHLENQKRKINTYYSTGWLFIQLVWSRPSSSGKAPAHLEKSNREDE